MYLHAGPFGTSVAPDSALQLVSELRAQLEALKEEEQSVRYGLNIFNIEEPASKDILSLEKVPIHCCYSKTFFPYNTTLTHSAKGNSLVLHNSKLNCIDTVAEGHFWFCIR